MENFCWEWEVLKHMSAMFDTGEPCRVPLFDKMLAAKNFQSGMQTVRQLEFRLIRHAFAPRFDGRRRVALDHRPGTKARSGGCPPAAGGSEPPHGFSHIFAGVMPPVITRYQWAEVLSADAYSLFEEQGVLSPAAGRRFRDEVLARGGSRPALESFIAFRGRAPQIEALLRHNGMLAS
jgi:oligopeptidase A